MPGAANPGWELNRLNFFQPPIGPHKFTPYREIFSSGRTPSCPSAIPHQDFVSMSKEDRRQLLHVNDMIIQHEGRP